MAKPAGCFDDEMGKKRQFHTLVHQKSQTNFFTKIPNNRYPPLITEGYRPNSFRMAFPTLPQ